MLENKIGMIFGVANKRSIAWACAQACIENGAKLAFTYQGERLKDNVIKLTKDIPNTIIVPCDVQNQAQVDAAFEAVDNEFGRLDFLIHSIAYAPREALEGEFLTTSREAFLTAMEISTFSLTQLSLAAVPLMKNGGSIITMSYYGAEKVVQNYNVMGVAKAALESFRQIFSRRFGQTRHPRQRDQRGTDQHAFGARREKYGRDVFAHRRKSTAPAQRRSPRSRQHRAFSGQRSGFRHYRRNDLR